MDPLSLLKDFNLRGKLAEVSSNGTRVNFGGLYVFPLATYTAFKSAQKEYYPLEVILNLLLNRHLTHPEYIKQANANKVGAVAFTDRKKLLDFLDGKAELQLDSSEALLSSVPTQAPPRASQSEDEPAAKKARLQEEEGGLTTIGALAKQERQLRNRNTMLIAPSKDFMKVLEIAEKAAAAFKHHMGKQQQQQQQQQAAKAKQQQHAKPASKPEARPGVQHTIPIKPSGRTEREVTNDQFKAMAGDAGDLANVLSMYGAYNKNTSASTQEQKPPPPPPPPPGGGGAKPHASGSGGGKPAAAAPGGSSRQQQPHGGSQATKPAKPVPGAVAERPKAGIPIIIVPSGFTSILNMHNVKQFLEAGRYEPCSSSQRAGNQKQSLVLVTRTAGKATGAQVPYHVIDKAPEKGSEDWKRVVAVITQGAKWQFKDWPFKGAAEGELSEVFSKVCGFYIYNSDEKIPDAVANWNVKRLGLHRENRHLDATVLVEFYRHLDTFLLSRKSKLAF